MNRRTGFVLAAIAAILMLFSNLPSSFAQGQDNDQDPPTRAGRIGYVQGSVSFQPGGQGDWVDAVPNRPLTTGDNLWADRGARAEVQMGSTSVRLGSETSITFLDLDNNVTQIRLSVGTLFFRVRHVGSDDTFEVDTPNLAFNVTQPGEYRLDVNENGDQTTAVVWHGDAEITGGGSSYRLSEGQEGTFSGVDQLRYDVGAIGPEDDFSRWALDRDERQDRARSTEYVSADMTGYQDLDEYGRWYDEPGYGHVWAPVGVPYGWAPYRYGHWVFISPWGWTWVEDEPWGFAPFHYGRWAYFHRGWCWVPGPVAVVPVYSPALVAFVGGGGFHVGIGVGGGVGWFPLAPGEVFVPWYRTSPRYVQNVNVTNTHVTVVQVTNVYNNVNVNRVNNVTYINQRQGRGITVVNQQTFVNAQSVHNNVIRVNARDLQRAPVTHEVVRNIQPDRQSVIGNARPVRFSPPQPVMTRPVVATRRPMMVNRVAPVPGVERTVAPPPVRTVERAPQGQAQPLQRGSRGETPGFRNGPQNAGQPGGNPNVDRRGGTPPQYGSRPNVPENNNPANRPAMNAPRPSAPQNAPSPQRGEISPRGPETNYPTNRPNNPDVNRPAQDNNRPAMPDRGMRNVPRPPSPTPDRGQEQQRTNVPTEQPRSNVPNVQPGNNTPRNTPETSRPNYQPTPPPENRHQNAPPETREAPSPRPNYQPAPPPENRHQNAPPEVRDAPSSRPNYQPTPPPQNRQQSAPPQAHNEQAPRPEVHNAPPPQHESRPQESRGGDKGGSQDHGRGKDNGPNKFR